MNAAEAQALFAKHQIKFVLAQFVDIHGAAKAKAVPVEHLEMVLTDGAGFAGFALWGFGMGPHGPDYMAVGDLSTLTPIPWMPGYARMVCNGTVKGKPYPYCSRVTLQRQLARLAEKGMTMYAGHRARIHAAGRATPTASSALSTAPIRSTSPATTTRACRAPAPSSTTITQSCAASASTSTRSITRTRTASSKSTSPTRDALKSADNFTFVKMAASEIARKHGHDRHLHAQAVLQPHRQRRAFPHLARQRRAEEPVRGQVRQARAWRSRRWRYQFLGGVLAHARALAAMCAPTVNSYKRLVVGRALSGATWAPAYIAYGDNNRTACVRIPGGRLELRLPDSGCNPYLALRGGGRRGPRRHRAQARPG